MFIIEEFVPGNWWHSIQLQVERESWQGTMSCERTLLLGEHVLDQVAHTVAVAKLVVVPADSEQKIGGYNYWARYTREVWYSWMENNSHEVNVIWRSRKRLKNFRIEGFPVNM